MDQGQQRLEELATYGSRKLLLWELAADGRSFLGIRFTASEHGLKDATVEEQVEAFVEDMVENGEIRQRNDEIVDWDALEQRYGDRVDELL